MNKVFELYIANALRDEERYAVLDLPATPYEMLDALERAGCRSSEEAYYQVEEYLDFEYLESVISPDCSLNHLNALAEKLSELNDRQSITFEGLLRMEQEKNEGQISIHTLLQLAHNADCCHVVGEARNDSQLGRFYAENDFFEELSDLPDKVFDLLDFDRIGREQRQAEGGVFTRGGYVVQNTELEQIPLPDDPPPKPDYTVLLKVSRGYFNDGQDDGPSVTIRLPASEEDLDKALEQLNVASWEECGYTCLDCAVPWAREWMEDEEDLGTIQPFAEELDQLQRQGQLSKYKALLLASRCEDLWDALEMADSMQSMVFTPSILSSQDAALAKLQTIFDADNLNILLRHLDLNGYGNELIAADHEELTPYGLIRQQNGEPIPIRQKENQEMGMEVCR